MAGALITVATSVVVIAAVADAATGPTWTVAPPVPVRGDATNSVLQDVTMTEPTDVWAVGTAWTDTTSHPLAVHWDGTEWTDVPVASGEDTGAESGEVYRLDAVDAVSRDEVWAVGAAESGSLDVGVILRYDGSAWSTVPSPTTTSGLPSTLSDIDMATSTEGWAVGDIGDGVDKRPLVLRWRDGEWGAVTLPVLNTPATLTAVSVSTLDDVWAVGSRLLPNGRHAVLALHWDGVAWTDAKPPSFGADDALVSVTGSGTDLWAVGSSCDSALRSRCTPLVLHLSRDVWSRVPAQVDSAVLTEVIIVRPATVWLVGHVPSLAVPQADHVEYWNGQRFVTDLTVQLPGPSQIPDGKPASALALAAATVDKMSGVIWAVGWSQGPTKAPHAIFRS
jgi:hypothetical protein